jgi:hypothetical protein
MEPVIWHIGGYVLGVEPIVVMALRRSVWPTNIDVEKWNSGKRGNSQV